MRAVMLPPLPPLLILPVRRLHQLVLLLRLN